MDRLADLKSDDPTSTDDPDMGNTGSGRDVELGTTGAEGSTTGASGAVDPVAEQMEVTASIRQATATIVRNTKTARQLLEQQMKAASAEDKQAIERKMAAILNETKANGMAVKRLVQELQEANKKFAEENVGSSTAAIRHNVLTKAINDYQTAIQEFESANATWKKAMQDTTRRELKNIGLDDKKIESVVQSGQAQAVLQAAISDDLTDVIDSIEARHASILALERSVREVQELFTDLAALVSQQQEHIDSIAKSIEHTVDYVQKGEKNLVTASEDQDTARKRQCCILVIVICVLFVVVGIPLLKTFA